jgi:hypothetical protein
MRHNKQTRPSARVRLDHPAGASSQEMKVSKMIRCYFVTDIQRDAATVSIANTFHDQHVSRVNDLI